MKEGGQEAGKYTWGPWAGAAGGERITERQGRWESGWERRLWRLVGKGPQAEGALDQLACWVSATQRC